MSLLARRLSRRKLLPVDPSSTLTQQRSGTFSSSGFTVSLPAAPSTNSCIVLYIAGNTTVTTPAGWTLRQSQVNYMGHYLYTLTGSVSSSWTVSSAAGVGTWWVGEVTNSTYDLGASSNAPSSSTAYTTPSITPASGENILLASIGSVNSQSTARTISSWTNSFNEVADVCNPVSDYPMQSVATYLVSADGSTNYNTSATYSAASTGRSAIICALKTTGATGYNDTSAPSVPSGLSASATGQSSASIMWNASSDNVAVTGYDVYRDGTIIASVATTSYTDSGLSPETTYNYTVRAKDASGNISAQSSAVSITTWVGGGVVNVLANPSAFGWPDATNTGPAQGTNFTVVPNQQTSGSGWVYNVSQQVVRVSGDGAELKALDIRCPVIVDSKDVLIEDCIITCDGDDYDATDVIALRNNQTPGSGYYCERPTIRRCRLNGMASNDHSRRARRCVSDNYGGTPGVIVEYCEMSGTGNFVTTPYEAVLRHNYCHSIGHRYSDHHSGFGAPGGAVSLHWFHNTLDMRDTPTDAEIYPAQPDQGGGLSSCTSIVADFARSQNVLVESNIIANKGFSYASSGGNHGPANDPGFPPTNIRFINNRYKLSTEAYGYIMAFNQNGPGNEWSGNVNDLDNSPANI